MKRLWYIIKCFLFANSPERKFKNWYEGLRNSAIEWNATTLTENTLSMQIRKVCEEICEVLDAQTREEVIKEIPSKKMLDMYASMMSKVLGIIVDHKI